MRKAANPMELVDRYLQAVNFWLPKTRDTGSDCSNSEKTCARKSRRGKKNLADRSNPPRSPRS
jgi:hypothetical protein